MALPKRAGPVEELVAGVVAYELWGEGDDADLLADERPIVANAVDSRKRHFAAGRVCARSALAELGARSEPILVAERRAPRWPDGFTGSISHTDGYAVAVASLDDPGAGGARRGVGIDAEQLGRVDDSLHDKLFVAAERHYIDGLESAVARDRTATAFFGAKEAFYKAQFVHTGAWVGFHDVAITVEGDVLVLRPATDLDVLDSFRWPITARALIRDGIVVTALEAVTAARP